MPPPESSRPSHEAETPGRVLVVDDSIVVRTMVGGFLRSAGYVVAEAENGRVAIACLETQEYDVVITDLRMPEVDGFGVLENVKRRSLATEVVILTGSHANDVAYAVRALRLGAHDFLTKPPSNPEEVIVTVERALEKKRLKESNLRLLRELEALSRTDPLTGVLNRRVFDESLRRELSRASRYELPLSLVMLDLDHFKRVNDTYGHPMGDEVLRAFARLGAGVFRDSDALHRYGGEEFVVLLPHTAFEGALQAANRLVKALADAPFRVGTETLSVTVSAGVGSATGRELIKQDLVKLADEALYEAKRAGRNRAVGLTASAARPRS